MFLYYWYTVIYGHWRGGGGMERGEPERAGATLKNFFAENSHQTPKSNFYIFLTLMHHNALDWTCNYMI